jgi:hypothetical protein
VNQVFKNQIPICGGSENPEPVVQINTLYTLSIDDGQYKYINTCHPEWSEAK